MIENQTKPAVLVVDDEPRILDSLRDLLEEDFVVLTSTDAQAALTLLGNEQIAVILADQRMPGLTGDQFLAKAKDLSAATRILITGYADINALVRAVNQGQIHTYVPKPWESRELKLTVAQAAEHCRLSRELVRERNLLHALMDNAPDAIWFKDTAGRFTRVNKALASLLGASDPALVIGKTDFDFVPSDEALESRAEDERILSERRRGSNKIHQLRAPDGACRWVSTTKAPVAENGHHAVALVGITRDVTEQVEAELALRESEQKYRQIVETAEEGVWILDGRHHTVFVNRRMADMLGSTVEEVLGRLPTDFMLEEDAAAQLQRFEECGAGASSADFRFRNKDGKALWTILAASPLLDPAGRRTGTLGMVTDITERRSLEDQFRQAQKLEAMGRLAGGVAHDFNNVLTVITGYGQLMLRQMESENPLRRPVEKIQRAADQAAALSRQLLTFSRQHAVQTEVLDLNAIVTSMQKMVQPLLGDDVELITILEPALGRVRADAGQIDQVLMNLVVNARDAMYGGGRVTIETKNVEPDQSMPDPSAQTKHQAQVMLAVSDTGSGMSAETMAHVFEPFFTTKPVGKGTGLGLSTVHGIVTKACGNITVASEPGRGTTFRVYLPRVQAELSQTSAALPAQSLRGSETILVVEDQVAVRELMRESLETYGYKVLEAGDGQEAIEICDRLGKSIHLVVSDLIMPRMSGAELAKMVRSRHPHTKVLYVTGYSGDVLAEESASGSQHALLQKPFTPEAFVLKVREVVGTPAAGGGC